MHLARCECDCEWFLTPLRLMTSRHFLGPISTVIVIRDATSFVWFGLRSYACWYGNLLPSSKEKINLRLVFDFVFLMHVSDDALRRLEIYLCSCDIFKQKKIKSNLRFSLVVGEFQFWRDIFKLHVNRFRRKQMDWFRLCATSIECRSDVKWRPKRWVRVLHRRRDNGSRRDGIAPKTQISKNIHRWVWPFSQMSFNTSNMHICLKALISQNTLLISG